MTQCQEIMKRDVEWMTPRESAHDAARTMRDENIGFLPVCDEGMKVLGTVTDRDIAIRLVADSQPASTAIEHIMTREVIACLAADDITAAEELMAEHRKSRIMCVDDDGRLVGVISLSDIAKLDGAAAASTLKEVSRRESHVRT